MANRRPAGDGMVRQKKRGQWEGRITVGHKSDEEAFADLLAQKTQKDIINEQKALQGELQRCTARNQKVAELYEKLYEDNVSGKVTDEWFM